MLVQPPSPEPGGKAPAEGDAGKKTAKKMYYLVCGFCRWTTRDIGLPDQPVASGGWPEPGMTTQPFVSVCWLLKRDICMTLFGGNYYLFVPL